MPRLKSVLWIVGALLGCAILFSFAPLFHIVPLKGGPAKPSNESFNANTFVEKLWADQLIPSAKNATDASTLLAAIKTDPKTAQKKFGKSPGLGGTYYYFVQGTGTVVTVDANSVGIALEKSATNSDVVLETGKIFGNAIRDGTGLVNVNDYPNSGDFNDISSEINRRVEERVLPSFRAKVTKGATVMFAGCAEIMSEETDLRPLHVIPIVAEVQ